MKVHELVALLAKANSSSDPMVAVREAMEGLRKDIDALAQALSYVSGIGGNPKQVFYRSPELTLLKVSFPNGRRTPPHDHGTWATILLMSGSEKNTLYRSAPGGLRKAGEATLERGSILPMMADTVHVAECLGDEPAIRLRRRHTRTAAPHVEPGNARTASAGLGFVRNLCPHCFKCRERAADLAQLPARDYSRGWLANTARSTISRVSFGENSRMKRNT
jgi:predicted metal-dependent enzyme (double-stranded beta helix superfamily)